MDDAALEDGSSQPRARLHNACLACQKRKSKCDGQRPSCCQCQKRLVQCVYQQRKFRGPGKSKEYAHRLEERLKRLEESLKPGSSSSTESFDVSGGGHAGRVQDTSNPPSALLEPTTTSMAPAQANALSQNPTTLHLCPLERTCITEPSNQVPNIQQPGPRPVFLQMHFIEFIRAVTETGASKMQLFSPQHGHSKILSRLDDIIQDISEMYPVLDMSHFQELLTPREPDNDVDKSARLAIGNASLALGIQCKTANSAFAELSPAAWAYFKSAFSTVPMLAFQGFSSLAHEAILIMAMFMLGSADLHMASHLNTLALRAYQTCEVSRSHKGFVETQSHLRVFWTLASLDIDLAFRIGIPPIISDLSDKDLPTENPSDPVGCPEVRGMNCGANIMRMRAELARIQIDTYRQMLSSAANRSSQQELSLRAERSDQDLESWKASIPSASHPREEYQPGRDILPLPVIVLHFIFHDLKMKLRSATGGNPLGDCIPWAWATIRLMHCLPTQQFAALWRVLVYPTSAALVLLAAVSNDVVGSHAQPAVAGIRELTCFLHEMSSTKGCDVGKLLPWFSRFEEVVARSIAHDSVHQHQEMQKHLSRVLSPGMDYLRLAQSFLGRMASDDAILIQTLSEILEIPWAPEDEFGPFVPDALKPKTHNFSFIFA
ncbi:Zn(2)-C6 fungal-type domain-containing protein [Fusarium sp. Ph1]|nr:Zn(2)-C6 fungal-type domain-containing protein [Fusarium sp. Ph1]